MEEMNGMRKTIQHTNLHFEEKILDKTHLWSFDLILEPFNCGDGLLFHDLVYMLQFI